MKTIRLLYPDYDSGGLETYYFGAGLMAHILPENGKQPLIKVEVERHSCGGAGACGNPGRTEKDR